MKKKYRIVCETTYTVIAESEEEAKTAVTREQAITEQARFHASKEDIEIWEERLGENVIPKSSLEPNVWPGPLKIVSVIEPPECNYQSCFFGGQLKGKERNRWRRSVPLYDKAEQCHWYEDGRCYKDFKQGFVEFEPEKPEPIKTAPKPTDVPKSMRDIIDGYSLVLKQGFSYDQMHHIMFLRFGDKKMIDEQLPKVLERLVDKGKLIFDDGWYHYTEIEEE